MDEQMENLPILQVSYRGRCPKTYFECFVKILEAPKILPNFCKLCKPKLENLAISATTQKIKNVFDFFRYKYEILLKGQEEEEEEEFENKSEIPISIFVIDIDNLLNISVSTV